MLVVVVALVASACTGGPEAAPEPDPEAPGRLAGVLRAGGDDAVDAAIEAFARAGVPTYDEERTLVRHVAEPTSGLRFLRFQVATMARSAGGDGIPGAQLDVLAPFDAEHPPLSALLAGYVAEVDSFGARLSRRLLEGQDLHLPQSVLFPRLVLALFVADLLPDAERTPPESVAAGGAPAAVAAVGLEAGGGGVCGQIRDFLDDTLEAIRDAAEAITGGGILLAILDFAGNVVGLAAKAILDLVDNIPFITALKRAVALVGTLVSVSAAIEPWRVDVTADPEITHLQVEEEPEIEGAFRAVVVPGPDPLEGVRPCAELVGIDLPPAEETTGAPVAWEVLAGFDEHAVETGREEEVGPDGSAGLGFLMQSEPAPVHRTGTRTGAESSATLLVEARVERGTVNLVRDLAEAVFGEGVLDGVVGQILGPDLIDRADDAVAKILELSEARGAGVVLVTYHEPQAARFSSVNKGHPASWTFEGVSCNGLEGPWGVDVEVRGNGVLSGMAGSGTGSFTLPDGTGPGTFTATVSASGFPAGEIGDALYEFDMEVTVRDGDPVVLEFEGGVIVTTRFSSTRERHPTFEGPVRFGGDCPS